MTDHREEAARCNHRNNDGDQCALNSGHDDRHAYRVTFTERNPDGTIKNPWAAYNRGSWWPR